MTVRKSGNSVWTQARTHRPSMSPAHRPRGRAALENPCAARRSCTAQAVRGPRQRSLGGSRFTSNR
jgi:hypothetical protein